MMMMRCVWGYVDYECMVQESPGELVRDEMMGNY